MIAAKSRHLGISSDPAEHVSALMTRAKQSETLRVVIISGFPPPIGGTERRTERLATGLVGHGVVVVVFTRRRPGLARLETIAGVPVHRLGWSVGGRVGALTFAVHALWLLATRFRDFGIVHAQTTNVHLLVGVAVKLLLRRRLFVTINSDPSVLLGPRRRTGPLRLRLIMLADVVGALSSQMRRQLVALGVPDDRVRLLPNAVDTDVYRPATRSERQQARSSLGLPTDDLVYLFIGRLHVLKRIEFLLRAWSKLPKGAPRRLLIVGDGPERDALMTLATSLHLGDVRFEPTTNDVVTYLKAADVFVLPSQHEGLSNALLEAMAVGLPAIVSDVDGNRALVSDGRDGLTFRTGDLTDLTEKLLQLESGQLRERLARGALEAVASYSIHKVAALHRDLYARAVARSA